MSFYNHWSVLLIIFLTKVSRLSEIPVNKGLSKS
jgi:hypothetical protein